jgi:hypothetical protein
MKFDEINFDGSDRHDFKGFSRRAYTGVRVPGGNGSIRDF